MISLVIGIFFVIGMSHAGMSHAEKSHAEMSHAMRGNLTSRFAIKNQKDAVVFFLGALGDTSAPSA